MEINGPGGDDANTVTGDVYGGRLLIRMGVKDDKVCDVEIRSTRPADAARVFEGRTPAEAAGMMGTLYSLCAQAQTVCALDAVEIAQGIIPPPAMRAARDVMRLAEMISQSALRVCLDWPRLLGLSPRADVVRGCLAGERALQAALFDGAPWAVPGGVTFAPRMDDIAANVDELTATVTDMLAGGFADDVRHSVTAAELDGFGRVDTARIEAGALARRWDDPAVARVRDAHGVGLATRLEARLVDLRHLLTALATVVAHVAPAEARPAPAKADGRGVAEVETVRGPLRHAVGIENGIVARYEISAPTDVNFAPTGAVAAGLTGADARDRQALNRAAELHALAVDPCVACSIEVGHA